MFFFCSLHTYLRTLHTCVLFFLNILCVLYILCILPHVLYVGAYFRNDHTFLFCVLTYVLRIPTEVITYTLCVSKCVYFTSSVCFLTFFLYFIYFFLVGRGICGCVSKLLQGCRWAQTVIAHMKIYGNRTRYAWGTTVSCVMQSSKSSALVTWSN